MNQQLNFCSISDLFFGDKGDNFQIILCDCFISYFIKLLLQKYVCRQQNLINKNKHVNSHYALFLSLTFQ